MDYTLPPDMYESLLQPESAYVSEAPDELTNLYRLKFAYSDEEKEQAKRSEVAGLRIASIRQEGLRQGTLTGLHWRYGVINEHLDKNTGVLDRVFSFTPFLENERILVPSVSRSRGVQEFDVEGEQYREAAARMTIAEEARLVSVAPTFRDYLYREYELPAPPHPVILPTNSHERAIWEKAVEEGWRLGIEQANTIFEDSVYELQNAIDGRINYRVLVATGYIEPAALQVTDMGVTYNGRTMNVGESLYQIATEAQYRPVTEWRAVWDVPESR